MPRYGFIHDKLDIKLLVLYIMARVAGPIDFATLTDLTMCDGGVDYFEFAEAAAELVASGHLTLEEGRYAITDKGRENGAACESSLPYSVKRKCDENLSLLNAALRRAAKVRSEIFSRQGDEVTLRLDRDDGREVYEGELYYDRTEYEFEIDASTGSFLEWSADSGR